MVHEYQFSVIIPHYNSYNLLARCLSSIPQTQNIQTIVVDDNSPDQLRLSSIISKFKNVTLKVLSNNFGAGRARNEGLRIAKGKWVIFSDADDYFSNHAFDIFHKYYNTSSDIIYFKVEGRDSTTNHLNERGIRYNTLIDNYQPDDIRTINALKYRYYVPWGKMINNDFIHKYRLQFEEIKYSNDVMFGVKAASYASNITVSNEVIYCVTVTNNSLTKTLSKQAFICRYQTAIRQAIFLKEINQSRYSVILVRYIVKSLHYGISCTINLLKYGIKARVNFFSGIGRYIR